MKDCKHMYNAQVFQADHLTLCILTILMVSPMYINTIRMGLSIISFKGS